MRCQSVACLWSTSPPLHRITAAAALNHPPTFYTGGSDGSIIWWTLSGHDSTQKITPMAMLCGHAAAIADLSICTPISESEKPGSNLSSTSAGSGALMSACTDGVLCVWSRGSGHCKRRRKLPPWVGTPSLLSPLPVSPRHVCIACICADSVGHSHGEVAGDGETHLRRAPKCAVVIVDSCTLNIVQTVFHGSLSIGPVKSMAVVPLVENGKKKQSAILVDGHGKTQFLAVLKESDPDGEGASSQRGSSSSDSGNSVWEESSYDGVVQAVAVAADGTLLALIFGIRCVFRLVGSGNIVGEISLDDSSLCNEDPSAQVHLIGGMFLQSYDSGGESEIQDLVEGFTVSFAVWNTNGAAIIYRITGSDVSFNFDPVCEIPPIPYPVDAKASVHFCQLNRSLVRVESICFSVGESSLWKPRVTIWSVIPSQLRKYSECGNPHSSIMLGEGGFPDDPIGRWSSLCLENAKEEPERSSLQRCSAVSENSNVVHGEDNNNGFPLNERIVSCSMVLSEDFYVPYAVVYGFYSGEIKVVRFVNLSPELNYADDSSHLQIDEHISERIFPGHTGAVLCLAAHRMATSSNERSFNRALVSGSLDSTVRIWDLDTCNLVSVMHHHIAPVRQIILPPPCTDRPWSDCFLTVGEDCCVTLVSLETLRVERMFPGHPSYPSMVVWDSARGYIACLCKNNSSLSDTVSVLYLWDVKTGARERIIRGTASHSMFDNFCKGINTNYITGGILGGTTSASSLLLPVIEDASFPHSHVTKMKGKSTSHIAGEAQRSTNLAQSSSSLAQSSKGNTAHGFNHDLAGNSSAGQVSSTRFRRNKKLPVKCSCPFPGVASLKFDLSTLMSPYSVETSDKELNNHASAHETKEPAFQLRIETHPVKESLEVCLLRFSLSFLHVWDVDHELDKLLMEEMNICKPEGFFIASGMLGDRDSLTLMFPGLDATLELWKSSSEFCAMRSLTIVSLAQRMISLSHSTSGASSALAAFYTRNFAEKVPDIKPPLLQLLVSFWQDTSEHVRMAARSLFHCAAPRAIPHPLCGQKLVQLAAPSSPINVMEEHVPPNTGHTSISSYLDSDRPIECLGSDEDEESSIVAWLESFEIEDWISCIGVTSQDAMASRIIVAAALVVWYPSIVKQKLAKLVVNQLIKLVMAMNDQYCPTAAELLAEGMDSTWEAFIGPEIPRLVGDIFFQIECVSGASANTAKQNPEVAVNIREALVGILLPSLAMADITGFLNVIDSQIWSTSSDSPVHLVSLTTLIRVIRGSPKPLAPYLDKVVNFVLQTMDPGNAIMRKACLNSSMVSLREIARVFPMVALNETSTRLAVGDAVGDVRSVTIRVYDIVSVTKIKVLDASGPPGLPNLLAGASDTRITTAITALSFSPDGEGLVAFSENGLMMRWWSLGTAWWEKLSRSVVPVQCTKLIFVPQWEGFSPNSSRSSIMESIIGHDNWINAQEKTKELDDADRLKLLLYHLDLSYRLHWVGGRTVVLTRHGNELGSFQL